MVVSSLVAFCLAGQLLLLASALQRLAVGPPLAVWLSAHDIVPRWARTAAVTWVLEVAQLAIGAVGITAVGLGLTNSWAFLAAGAATAIFYTGFTGYLIVLLTRRGRVQCGCLGGHDRANAASVGRAGLFAMAAIAALSSPDHPTLAQWPIRVGVLLAAILIAALATFVVSLADVLTDRGSSWRIPGRFPGDESSPAG